MKERETTLAHMIEGTQTSRTERSQETAKWFTTETETGYHSKAPEYTLSNYTTQTSPLGLLSFLLHSYLQTGNRLPSAFQQSVWRLLNPSACLSINSISPCYIFNKKLLLFLRITVQRQHNVLLLQMLTRPRREATAGAAEDISEGILIQKTL